MDIYSVLRKIAIKEFDFLNFYSVPAFEKFENHSHYFEDIVVILGFSHRFRCFIFKNLVVIIF